MASGSDRPRRKDDLRKLRDQPLGESYTRIAFWNFMYPWAGEMNFMDELRGDILFL